MKPRENPVRARRLQKGLTGKELARRAGLATSYLCDIEKGRVPLRCVRVEFARAIAEELGAEVADIFPRAESRAA